jgi:curved DNA-binding protein CbpA
MRAKNETAADITLYELLEVEPTAPPEEIKTAYFRLAKRLHPDHRVGLKIADDDGILDRLYLRVKEAYEVLSSETERRRYDFALAQKAERQARAEVFAAANPAPKGSQSPPAAVPETGPKKTFTPEQTARIHFGNGERYFGEGRFHEAIEELRAAVRLDPAKPEYYRALARALAKNPRWKKQAEEAYAKALELNRFDAESYLGLGELYHDGGLASRARKMFEEALTVDPDNAQARERLGAGHSEGSALGRWIGMVKRSRNR